MIKILCSLCIVLTLNIARANEISLSVCHYPDGVYQFSITGEVAGWWFNNVISYDLDKKTAVGDGAEFVVYYFDGTTESIFADPDNTPTCQADEWQPDAPSIVIPLNSDCAFVEIQDAWGNYHRVESNGEPVLLHYGQALIGSYSESIDPADYRVVPTECY